MARERYKPGWRSEARRFFSDEEIRELDPDDIKEFLKWKEIEETGGHKDFSKIQQNKNKKWIA